MTECARFQRLVISGAQVDPGMFLVGSTPYIGDVNQTGVVLPAEPTVAQDHRLLTVCCGLRLGPNVRCIVQRLRLLATIGTELEMAGGATLPVEVPVTTPWWHFVDGSISYHLRRVSATYEQGFRPFYDVPAFVLPFMAQDPSWNAGILTRRMAGPYIPLANGIPPGTDVGGLGTMRDMRYPYSHGDRQSNLGIEVLGPCDLVLFASVHQTNPETRPRPNQDLPLFESLVPEDQFVIQYPDSRYWRVGGEMVVDVCNPQGEQDTTGLEMCGVVAKEPPCR